MHRSYLRSLRESIAALERVMERVIEQTLSSATLPNCIGGGFAVKTFAIEGHV